VFRIFDTERFKLETLKWVESRRISSHIIRTGCIRYFILYYILQLNAGGYYLSVIREGPRNFKRYLIQGKINNRTTPLTTIFAVRIGMYTTHHAHTPPTDLCHFKNKVKFIPLNTNVHNSTPDRSFIEILIFDKLNRNSVLYNRIKR